MYLSLAPKSNAVYKAYGAVQDDLQSTMAEPVPLHIRNAVTGLMKNIGYGKGYQYAHDAEEKGYGHDLPSGKSGGPDILQSHGPGI